MIREKIKGRGALARIHAPAGNAQEKVYSKNRDATLPLSLPDLRRAFARLARAGLKMGPPAAVLIVLRLVVRPSRPRA
jgi:hypothetical protein